MKKQRIFAVITAMVMSVGVLFATGISAKAEEGEVTTEKVGKISLDVENEVGKTNPLTDEDLEVLAKTLVGENGRLTNNGTTIINENTIFSVNWDESELTLEDICAAYINCYWFTRDDSDRLIQEAVTGGGAYVGMGSNGHRYPNYGGSVFWQIFSDETTFSFHVTDQHGEYSRFDSFDESKTYGRKPDLVHIKFGYNAVWKETSNGKIPDSYPTTGWYFIVENENSPFHFKETSADDPATEETYVVEISNDNAKISNEAFAAMLTENQTKDVVIKAGDEISFTFKAGTMKAADGKDSYDFSVIINRDYATVTGLPSFVTSDNFIQRIDYGYSGQLPAEAFIHMYVGTKYAGQTLYYSQLLNDTSISVVQPAQVDAEGYITVKQSRCSSYLVTSTEPKETETMEDATSSNTEDTTLSAGNNNSPQTGDASVIIPYILLCIGAFGGTLVLRKRVKA